MTTSEIQSQITAAALQNGVPPSLALAVAKTESGFNQNKTSGAGAIGIMQLMPGTAADLNVNPNDPAQNIQGGVAYLGQQLRKYNGDVTLALEAYNEGPGAVDKGKLYPETQSYVASVLASQGQFTDSSTPVPFDPANAIDITTQPDATTQASLFPSSVQIFGTDIPLPLAVAGVGLGVFLLAKLFGD